MKRLPIDPWRILATVAGPARDTGERTWNEASLAAAVFEVPLSILVDDEPDAQLVTVRVAVATPGMPSAQGDRVFVDGFTRHESEDGQVHYTAEALRDREAAHDY